MQNNKEPSITNHFILIQQQCYIDVDSRFEISCDVFGCSNSISMFGSIIPEYLNTFEKLLENGKILIVRQPFYLSFFKHFQILVTLAIDQAMVTEHS